MDFHDIHKDDELGYPDEPGHPELFDDYFDDEFPEVETFEGVFEDVEDDDIPEDWGLGYGNPHA